MTRRSWRDLAGSDTPAESGTDAPRTDADALHRIVAGLPNSQLTTLLAERARLETHLATITGQNTGETDSRRYPVTPLAERRAEIDAWARARDAQSPRPVARSSSDQGEAAAPEAGSPVTEGLSRDVIGASSRLRSRVFSPARSGLRRFDDVVEPVRELGRKATGMSDTLNDLDRKLAAEGVSKAERDAIRRDLGGSTLDSVSDPIRRADDALSKPRQLAEGLENRWKQREEQLAGPLDRFGGYAASRDTVLGMDTGGSGDVFARADAARQRALDRRSERDREERRAEQLHDRHHQRSLAEKQESERLDRRNTRAKGV